MRMRIRMTQTARCTLRGMLEEKEKENDVTPPIYTMFIRRPDPDAVQGRLRSAKIFRRR